jgi:hypothetical protein
MVYKWQEMGRAPDQVIFMIHHKLEHQFGVQLFQSIPIDI